jgi:hypothetical protein
VIPYFLGTRFAHLATRDLVKLEFKLFGLPDAGSVVATPSQELHTQVDSSDIVELFLPVSPQAFSGLRE